MQNGHIQPITSEHAQLILTKFSALIDMWMGMTFVWRSLKGRCYDNQLVWRLFANVEIDYLQSSLWHFKTKCNIVVCVRALTPAMMQLYPVKIW